MILLLCIKKYFARTEVFFPPILFHLCAIGSCGCGPIQDRNEMEKLEIKKTEELMGVAITKFPHKQEEAEVIQIEKLERIKLELNEQKFDGKPLLAWYEPRNLVTHSSKKEPIAAYCGYLTDEIIDGHHNFKSDLMNARHEYGAFKGMSYFPRDIIIGKFKEESISPLLIFYDVGPYYGRSFAFEVNNERNAHLVISEIYGDKSRLKTYWAIGDLKKKSWEKLYLVEHHPSETTRSHLRSTTTKDAVHFLMSNRYREAEGDSSRLVLYSLKNDRDFEKPVVLNNKDNIREFDLSGCSKSNHLLIAYSTNSGLFLMAKQAGNWRASQIFPDEIKSESQVTLECVGPNSFLMRVANETDRQFAINLLSP
jgi:hypothetical protein